MVKSHQHTFYWVDPVRKGQFTIYWELGRNTKANYFTKHQVLGHCKNVGNGYLHEALVLSNCTLQGCVGSSPWKAKGNPDVTGLMDRQSTGYECAMFAAIQNLMDELS
eukprot:7531146-Ditylum_brightwellii.AAC.1